MQDQGQIQPISQTDMAAADSLPVRIITALILGAFHVARLAVLTFMMLIEPVVRIVLCAAGFILTWSALLLRWTRHDPHLPFWSMIAYGIGCLWILAIFYWVMKLLGAPSSRN